MNGLCRVSEAADERARISTLSVENSHASGVKVSLEAGFAGVPAEWAARLPTFVCASISITIFTRESSMSG
jgi:hypothetical protein